MNELQTIFQFKDEMSIIMQPYRAAIQLVRTKLESLDDEMRCTLEHNPIHTIYSRIKSPNSILEKLQRKALPTNIEGLHHLYDIAGLRVICHYVNDIHYVAQLLVGHEDIFVIDKKNYIQYPKENGYRSLHLIIAVPIYQKDGKIMVPVEIQIRTIAMDCWASLEHELHYKGHQDISESMYLRLKQCAKNMAQTDDEMQRIYQELNRKWSKI